MSRIADTEVSRWLLQPLRCRQCHWDIKTWLLQLLESIHSLCKDFLNGLFPGSLPVRPKCYLIEQTLKASRIVVSTDSIYSENTQVTVQSISPSSFSTSFVPPYCCYWGYCLCHTLLALLLSCFYEQRMGSIAISSRALNLMASLNILLQEKA